jgi:hypothetical protein
VIRASDRDSVAQTIARTRVGLQRGGAGATGLRPSDSLWHHEDHPMHLMRLSLFVAAALLPLLSACVAASVEPRLASVDFPVLVGPIIRIGGQPGDTPPGEAGAVVKSLASFTSIMTSETHGTGALQTTETKTKNTKVDNCAKLLRASVKGWGAPLVIVSRVWVEAQLHISVLASTHVEVKLDFVPWGTRVPAAEEVEQLSQEANS